MLVSKLFKNVENVSKNACTHYGGYADNMLLREIKSNCLGAIK